MTRKVVWSGRFKKDVKRYRHDLVRLRKLYDLLSILQSTGVVPKENKPHKLHGVYEGCMECHIEDDYLLVWMDEEMNVVRLVRLGTHHELFGN